MSYILDALKRSEQERHQGELTPTAIDTIMYKPRQAKHQWWPYLLIAVLLINLGVYLYFQFTRNASDPVKSSQIERVDQEDVVKSRKDTHQIINEKISALSQNLTTTRKSPVPSSPLNTISNSPGSQVRALPEHVLQTPSLNKHYDLSQKQAVSLDKPMEAAKLLTNQQPGRSQPQAEFNDEGFEIIRPKQAVELNTATLEGAGYGNV